MSTTYIYYYTIQYTYTIHTLYYTLYTTIYPKYSTDVHQNTTFYANLNGEHAGEGFMALRSIVLEIWTREPKIMDFPKN